MKLGISLGSMPVAIVNSTFARLFLPPGNPLGHRFREGTNAWLTVVGCVPDLVYDAVEQYHQPAYYQPLTQRSSRSMVISLHGGGRALDWAKPLRAEVARLQPDLAIYHVATTQALIDRDTIGYYLASLLLGIKNANSSSNVGALELELWSFSGVWSLLFDVSLVGFGFLPDH